MQFDSSLQFPDTYLITGEDPNHETTFINRIISCLNNGISLFQFRAPLLPESKYILLAEKILDVARKHNAKLILNCSLEAFIKVNADGLQLNGSRLYNYTSRPLQKNKILFTSCQLKVILFILNA